VCARWLSVVEALIFEERKLGVCAIVTLENLPNCMRVINCETDLVGGFQFGAALYQELYSW
jgi:hypothetical protein